MKEVLSVKTLIGLLSSTAITGTLLVGFGKATNNVPEHWVVAMSRMTHPVEVSLVSNPDLGLECEWTSRDPANRVAQCPKVLVTAKRLRNGAATGAPIPVSDADGTQLAARTHPALQNP